MRMQAHAAQPVDSIYLFLQEHCMIRRDMPARRLSREVTHAMRMQAHAAAAPDAHAPDLMMCVSACEVSESKLRDTDKLAVLFCLIKYKYIITSALFTPFFLE